jgi:hypothetical protein
MIWLERTIVADANVLGLFGSQFGQLHANTFQV